MQKPIPSHLIWVIQTLTHNVAEFYCNQAAHTWKVNLYKNEMFFLNKAVKAHPPIYYENLTWLSNQSSLNFCSWKPIIFSKMLSMGNIVKTENKADNLYEHMTYFIFCFLFKFLPFWLLLLQKSCFLHFILSQFDGKITFLILCL